MTKQIQIQFATTGDNFTIPGFGNPNEIWRIVSDSTDRYETIGNQTFVKIVNMRANVARAPWGSIVNIVR